MYGILHPQLHTANKQDDFTIFDKIVDLFAIFTFNHYYSSSLYVCFLTRWNEDTDLMISDFINNISFVNSKISMKYCFGIIISLLFSLDNFHLISWETHFNNSKNNDIPPYLNKFPSSLSGWISNKRFHFGFLMDEYWIFNGRCYRQEEVYIHNLFR